MMQQRRSRSPVLLAPAHFVQGDPDIWQLVYCELQSGAFCVSTVRSEENGSVGREHPL
jgi:hypothetical protein